MFCLFLAYLSLFLKIQVLVESWPKKNQNLCELLSVFSFWKISILILSIAGSGKIFLLEWDCSGFPSITPLFSTYASLIVLLLARLSIFVETLFFLNWEYKYETFKSNIQFRGYHEVFVLLPSFLPSVLSLHLKEKCGSWSAGSLSSLKEFTLVWTMLLTLTRL